jgi:FAD/FMN-containing dehydrogenase
MGEEFVNWSGSVRFRPDRVEHPASEQEVVDLVRRAAGDGRVVRPVGSGHSSMPLMATPDVLVDLGRMSGVVDIDRSRCRASVLPGTGLADAGDQLSEGGLAMENLGDVDYQAIAGAIGTGTHGTGIELGNLSTMLAGGRLVTGTGDVIDFSEDDPADHDLLRAAQVSLGALGILTSLTLRLVPAVPVRRRTWCTHIDWATAHFSELAASNRRFDMYWYPRSDLAQVRTVNELDVEGGPEPPGELRSDTTGLLHEIVPQSRDLRFDEMEYMLPVESGLDCLRVVMARIKERHRQRVAWRVLVRTVAADDAMLSNCWGRTTMTIALLHNAELPHDEYFGDMEPVLCDFDGRPHWGKKHTQRARDLRRHYPDWDRFEAVRRRLDPHGVFLNEHLRDLLEDGETSEVGP